MHLPIKTNKLFITLLLTTLIGSSYQYSQVNADVSDLECSLCQYTVNEVDHLL